MVVTTVVTRRGLSQCTTGRRSPGLTRAYTQDRTAQASWHSCVCSSFPTWCWRYSEWAQRAPGTGFARLRTFLSLFHSHCLPALLYHQVYDKAATLRNGKGASVQRKPIQKLHRIVIHRWCEDRRLDLTTFATAVTSRSGEQ